MKSHNMKAILRIALLFVLFMPFSSCMFEEVDMGFPSSVTFSKEGGTQVIYSDREFTYAGKIDYKSGDESGPSLDWLEIECENSKHPEVINSFNKITIKVKPNNTGKSRTLHIEAYDCYDYAVIKVTQKK